MLFHDLELFVSQPAGLVQNRIGDFDLSDIMHGRSHGDISDVVLGESGVIRIWSAFPASFLRRIPFSGYAFPYSHRAPR